MELEEDLGARRQRSIGLDEAPELGERDHPIGAGAVQRLVPARERPIEALGGLVASLPLVVSAHALDPPPLAR